MSEALNAAMKLRGAEKVRQNSRKMDKTCLEHVLNAQIVLGPIRPDLNYSPPKTVRNLEVQIGLRRDVQYGEETGSVVN